MRRQTGGIYRYLAPFDPSARALPLATLAAKPRDSSHHAPPWPSRRPLPCSGPAYLEVHSPRSVVTPHGLSMDSRGLSLIIFPNPPRSAVPTTTGPATHQEPRISPCPAMYTLGGILDLQRFSAPRMVEVGSNWLKLAGIGLSAPHRNSRHSLHEHQGTR